VAANPPLNPRAEAAERLRGRYEPRVLEPSPPAVNAPPWFADDPVARGEAPEGKLLVSPVHTGDLRWQELADEDSALAEWCAERWLASHRRLGPAPPALVPTRLALHRLAEEVVSPARKGSNGKIGLRYTRGGFGTPFFGADAQVRVEGIDLIVAGEGVERRERITTVGAAAALLGPELLPEPGADGGQLEVDDEAAVFVGDWYGFACSVLEELRAEATVADEPSRVQLWPEHFDMALELGAEPAGTRAAYGLSPGDDDHPDPYAYVAPWTARPSGELWQAGTFSGAELPYHELLDADDQRGAALEFFRVRAQALAAGTR